MLNYAETASSSTIFSFTSLQQSQCQEHSTDRILSVFSYTIGPIDPTQLLTMQAYLSDREACTLLMPLHLPRPILNDPAFRDGYEYNYLSEEGNEEEEWTTSVTRLVNHIYTSLTDDRFHRDLDSSEALQNFLPWQAGWLLRDLTCLAETDRILAYVGIAHLCFLLPLLAQERPANWPRYESYRADILHSRVVIAYRARVHAYREQGKSYNEAQCLALR